MHRVATGAVLVLVAVVVLQVPGSVAAVTADSQPIDPGPSERVAGPAAAAGQDNGTAGPPPDPANDTIGWEGGYWANESVAVDNSDGLNASEIDAVVSRAMARVEHVREREFNESVSVEVVSRAEFRNGSAPEYQSPFRTFDNAKFEALLFVGENTSSLAVQQGNRGSNVLGYYDPRNGSIVLVSDTGQPQIDGEATLAHELTHALQDQLFDLSAYSAATRDEANAQNGVIEGEANLVQRQYMARCGDEWSCVQPPSADGAGTSDLHYGIYLLNYFPYSDGPGFVDYYYDQGGWDRVDQLYAAGLPNSSEQVIYPEKFGSDPPENVSLTDETSGDWERVRPGGPEPGQGRPAYATLGQSAIATMFMYAAYDGYNESSLLRPTEFLNLRPNGTVNASDPIRYGIDVSDGWEGDRMHVYRNPDAASNETAYVWRTAWESEAEAREFVAAYRDLLAHWGGEPTQYRDVWTVDGSSPFTDAFHVSVENDTVTIVNAPTVDDLPNVHESAELQGGGSNGTGTGTGTATATATAEAPPTETATATDATDDGDAETGTETPTSMPPLSPTTDEEEAPATPEPTEDSSGAFGPGFGVGAAVLALLAAALVARRRG